MSIIVYSHIRVKVGRRIDEDVGDLVRVRYEVFEYLVTVGGWVTHRIAIDAQAGDILV